MNFYDEHYCRLKAEWKAPDNSISSTQITIHLVNTFGPSNESCALDQWASRSCANAESRKDCEARCGIGSGFLRYN